MTEKQTTFIAALLQEPTHTAAAEAVGISRRTAERWLADPEIQEAYQQQIAALLEANVNGLTALQARALEVLNRLMIGEAVSDNVKLAAAKTVLDASLKYTELLKLEKEIAEVKQMLSDRGIE